MVASKTVVTKKPISILQVFHNYILYKKDQKSYADRKDQSVWKNEISSNSGSFIANKLVLSSDKHQLDLQNCDLVILNDFNEDTETETLKKHSSRWSTSILKREKDAGGCNQNSLVNVQCFNFIDKQKKDFEIFKLKENIDNFELHLFYDAFEIGAPKRDNFKLCNLETNVPIEVKINGKLDHTLTSGAERTFKEHCYIFHLLGQTNTIEFISPSNSKFSKSIPIPQKTVNLMKVLH
ncbi:MAG: hypothetical protein R2753_14410 [Chitinophagales bacterium]